MNTDLRLLLSSIALGFVGSFGGAYLLAESLLMPSASPANIGGLDAELAQGRSGAAYSAQWQPHAPDDRPLIVSLPMADATPTTPSTTSPLTPPPASMAIHLTLPTDAPPTDAPEQRDPRSARLMKPTGYATAGAEPAW
ncbi:MAG: hypothetical protein IT306_15905 [Chloroflexi bacterium]|nr:hypothetical protein [Chloroflexota bacterium]